MAEAKPPMNFAAAALKKKDAETPMRQVQVEGQVILKIVEHCKAAMPNLVTGQLLGLDIGQTLEVTDCFPFPNVGDEDDEVGTPLFMSCNWDCCWLSPARQSCAPSRATQTVP